MQFIKFNFIIFPFSFSFREKIILKEKDIETIKNELEITYDEAKALLIKNKGDMKKSFESFLNDFKFSQI